AIRLSPSESVSGINNARLNTAHPRPLRLINLLSTQRVYAGATTACSASHVIAAPTAPKREIRYQYAGSVTIMVTLIAILPFRFLFATATACGTVCNASSAYPTISSIAYGVVDSSGTLPTVQTVMR